MPGHNLDIQCMSDRVFAIAGIKQREHHVTSISQRMGDRCDYGCVKLIFFLIKISSKFKVMFFILGLKQAQTG